MVFTPFLYFSINHLIILKQQYHILIIYSTVIKIPLSPISLSIKTYYEFITDERYIFRLIESIPHKREGVPKTHFGNHQISSAGFF
jgi:hypothetical protein